jgi:serine phosphatase RsbU (regulator of sigma subunit)/Tfp pilus assembly protein PilF
VGSLPAQNIDSLKQIVKTSPSDTARCSALTTLVDAVLDENEWPKYNNEIIRICELKLKNVINPVTVLDTFYMARLSNAYNNKGYELHNKEDLPKAIEFYNKSLEIEKKINNKVNLALVYNNLGGIYIQQKAYENAIEFFLKSLAIRIEIGDKKGIGQIYGNLGSTYDVMEQLDKAMHFYEKALETYKTADDPMRVALTLNNIGTLFEDKGDFEKAMEYFLKSLEIQKRINNERGLCVVWGNISDILIKQKKYVEAKQFAQQALIKAKKIGYPALIQSQAVSLYKIESALGHFKEALEYHKLYYTMRDSINSVENASAAIKEQMKFEYEKQTAVDKAVHDKELLLSGEREQKQRLISISIGVGLVLILIFAVFVFNRLRITRKQKKTIEEQKHLVEEKSHIIEEKQKEIIDSINYAKRIQHTLLAHDEFLTENLPEHFVFFKPKDIVSGDFYWATSAEAGLDQTSNSKRFYLAVCDSTGHGVPGAFMSLLNISFLNEAITEKKINQPNEILNHVRQRLIDEISKDGGKDGMDGILLCIETLVGKDGSESKKITYAAANNHPVLVSGGVGIELGKDKMPVGKGEKNDSFTLRTVEAKKGDSLYLYTDGFADQFGGPKGKKFKYKTLNQLLVDNSNLSPEEQKNKLRENFESWKGSLEQVDDVCVIGIRL